MANVKSTTTKAISNKVSFTAGRVSDFKCPDGKRDAFLWDTKQPGLGIRAFSSGKKTYIFQAWVNGRTHRTVIGPVESFDIDMARAEAGKLQVAASQNVSPAKVKRERAAAAVAEEQEIKRGLVTLRQVWEEYLAANKSYWGDKHYNDHLKAVQQPGLPWARGKGRVTKAGCLNPLIDVKVGELTAAKIKNWLEKENQSRPGVATQTYRLLFACLNWCSEQEQYLGLVDVHSLRTRDVKKTVTKLKPRHDVLQKEQLPAFFTYVRQIENPVIAAYVQTLLLTGARRNELMSLKWDDVDFQWKSLTIRDKATSQGQDDGFRIIPLTPYVESLLVNLPRRNQWVFSSPTAKSGKLTEPRKSFEPALKAAAIEGLTFHGLRRSFSTLSEWVEVPVGVVAQIMGHKPSATAEKHYKQRPLDLLRKWHVSLEGWFLEQAGINIPKNSSSQMRLIR
ncbi:tyrosine-type recombinase/integrase [Shewanella sp. JBTF-M18]|uniref:Tyrosine-type recombinase/integrase n=1 Tax=Shewanella insulae TaxID=2681496 RepID=A0A6L7HUI7_9GAMM|nr:site-specific integrase [Shewanella insulae]MXR67976.1 tyrosine-type recombinase/integrase [Shewanella insulae]